MTRIGAACHSIGQAETVMLSHCMCFRVSKNFFMQSTEYEIGVVYLWSWRGEKWVCLVCGLDFFYCVVGCFVGGCYVFFVFVGFFWGGVLIVRVFFNAGAFTPSSTLRKQFQSYLFSWTKKTYTWWAAVEIRCRDFQGLDQVACIFNFASNISTYLYFFANVIK